MIVFNVIFNKVCLHLTGHKIVLSEAYLLLMNLWNSNYFTVIKVPNKQKKSSFLIQFFSEI